MLIDPCRAPHEHVSTLTDAAWRVAYRLGFPAARLWWRLRGQQHEGALVAIHVDRCLLLLRSSYRTAWNFPGGSVRRGETPELAARRELAEEIGLATREKLRPVAEARGLWDGRHDHVHFFELRLEALPPLRFDNREIVGARLATPGEALNLRLTEPVRGYLERLNRSA
jgi:8-oxo-dGTP diphosphatase